MGSVNFSENENESDSPTEENKESLSDEEEENVRRITKNLKDARDHTVEWREEARSCYDYYAGHQWDKRDVQKLQEEERPVITFNRVFRTINGITGLETQNRQEIRFDPMEEDDGGKAEVWDAAIKWVRSNCDAEDEESEMFQDTGICGMGWAETRVDYDSNLDGDITEGRIDPLQMLWDINARKRNLADRRWQARYLEFTKEEFKELWPDKEPEYGAFWSQNENQPHDSTDAWKYENDQADPLKKRKCIGVFQYQEWMRETVYRIVDDNGQIIGLQEHKFEKVRDFVESENKKYIKQPRKVFKQYFINGNQILEMGDCPISRFSFNCTTGFRDRNTNTWFGIITPMKDPQMWANKWLSQILHIINSNAKGGLMLEEGAAKSIRDLEDNWSKPNKIAIFNNGALTQGKVQQREAPRYPDGVDKLLQMAMQSIGDIPGVNLEMLGVANRDQPASLELSRKEAGVTILSTLFDGLRRFRKEQGRILAEFIEKYIADGRLIRIVGDRRKQFIPLLKDHLSLKYDVIIDESPKSPNMQERVFGVLSGLLPVLLQAGIPVPPEIIDYAPIPETLKTKWKEMLNDPSKQQQDQQMKQITAQMAVFEAQKKQKEIAKTESETTLNMAKAQETGAQGQHEQALAANNLGIANAQQANKNQLTQSDMQRKNSEMVINEKRKELEFLLEQERLKKEHDMKMTHAQELHNFQLKQSTESNNGK